MRLLTRTTRLLTLSFALAAFAGCPDDPVAPIPEAGGGGGGGGGLDAGNAANDGGSTQADSGPVVRRQQPTNSLTAGGGKGENANYKVRVLIGGPTAVGDGDNTNNTVKIGAGAAQHGQ